MNRLPFISLTSLVLMLGGTMTCHAGIRSYHDLSSLERDALAESKTRVITYDYALQNLDLARKKHQIGPRTYARRYWELVGYIGDEASYQNVILIKRPRNASDSNFGDELQASAEKVWDDGGKYVVVVPGYLAMVVLEGLCHSGITISP
jgi:hypothetical protein